MNPFAHLNDSLSASRIGTYLRCPLRYFFSYIEKRPWETLQRDGEAHIGYMSCVKLKKPEVIESDFQVGEDQLRWARGLVTGVKKAMDAELYHPTPSVMSCGGCPFASACAVSSGTSKISSRKLFTTSGA